MSHLSTSHDTSRATAVVRAVSPTSQVHILLSRACGFLINDRNELAETSFLRAMAILDRQGESESATFGSLRAMTISGMFSFGREEYDAAQRAHECVVEAIPEDPMDLVSKDPHETAEHVVAFLKLQAYCLGRIRRRTYCEDALADLAEAN